MKKDICKGCKWYDEKLGCKNRSLAKLYQYIQEQSKKNCAENKDNNETAE